MRQGIRRNGEDIPGVLVDFSNHLFGTVMVLSQMAQRGNKSYDLPRSMSVHFIRFNHEFRLKCGRFTSHNRRIYLSIDEAGFRTTGAI